MRYLTRYTPRRARHCPMNGARSARPTRCGFSANGPKTNSTHAAAADSGSFSARCRAAVRVTTTRNIIQVPGNWTWLLARPGLAPRPARRRGQCPAQSGTGAAAHRGREKLQRRLDRLQVLGRDEEHIVAPVLGDLDTLMGPRDIFGDLRQSSLDLRSVS